MSSMLPDDSESNPPAYSSIADVAKYRFSFDDVRTYFIRGDKVYEDSPDARVVYELSNLLDGSKTPIAIQQNLFHLTETGQLKRLLKRHIYDIRPNTLACRIDGKSPSSWIQTTMQRDITLSGKGWGVYKGPTAMEQSDVIFTSSDKFTTRFRRGPPDVEWKNANGEVVATAVTLPEPSMDLGTYANGQAIYCPDQKLELAAGLPEKELNLLIAAWCMSIWKQNQKKNREPLSLNSVKESLQNHKWSQHGYTTHG